MLTSIRFLENGVRMTNRQKVAHGSRTGEQHMFGKVPKTQQFGCVFRFLELQLERRSRIPLFSSGLS